MADPENKLASYLARKKLSHRAFARLAKIPHLHPMISLWARGLARPGLEIAVAIDKATGGKVPASWWLTVPQRHRSA